MLLVVAIKKDVMRRTQTEALQNSVHGDEDNAQYNNHM